MTVGITDIQGRSIAGLPSLAAITEYFEYRLGDGSIQIDAIPDLLTRFGMMSPEDFRKQVQSKIAQLDAEVGSMPCLQRAG